jgi:CubicO group peptidase (beta-lactamase class C family)
VSGGGAASASLAPIFDVLDGGVGRAYPGAVLEVLHRDELVIRHAVGSQSSAQDARAATTETIYDLASLTKVLVTTPLLLQAAAERRLRLDDPLAVHLPEAHAPGVTLRHLLSHSSGLPAWIPFYLGVTGYEAVVAHAAAAHPTAPAGDQVVYSDLGFILLGEVVRRAFGSPLDTLAAQRIFGPLEMRDTTYRPSSILHDRIAPTEDGTAIEQAMAGEAGRRHRWRRYLIWGEVHDSNAYAMGGVSGHAGVFGTADDVMRYARMWLAEGLASGSNVLPREFAQAATRGQPPDRTRGLGWALTGPHGWWGAALSPNAFGHTGFTGTSIVIDPEHTLAIVLLSNAVHLGRDRTEIVDLRRKLAAAVARAFY